MDCVVPRSPFIKGIEKVYEAPLSNSPAELVGVDATAPVTSAATAGSILLPLAPLLAKRCPSVKERWARPSTPDWEGKIIELNNFP